MKKFSDFYNSILSEETSTDSGLNSLTIFYPKDKIYKDSGFSFITLEKFNDEIIFFHSKSDYSILPMTAKKLGPNESSEKEIEKIIQDKENSNYEVFLRLVWQNKNIKEIQVNKSISKYILNRILWRFYNSIDKQYSREKISKWLPYDNKTEERIKKISEFLKNTKEVVLKALKTSPDLKI